MSRSVNPATEALIHVHETWTDQALEEALLTSAAAYASWSARSLDDRIAAVSGLIPVLRSKRQSLAELMSAEMGKPLREALAEVDKSVMLTEWYCEKAKEILAPRMVESAASSSWVAYEPAGAVLGIMPWNFPVWQAWRYAIPALIGGNVALLKHAENVWGCASAMQELFVAAGLDEGLFTHLPIDLEQTAGVIADSRVVGVAFTGSEVAGRKVAALAGAALKPTVLELGGADPFVILADADIDAAIDDAMVSRFLNCGQSCIAAKRIIVEAPAYDEVLAKLQSRIEALSVGDPRQGEFDIGPMARADLRDQLHQQVLESVALGAEVLVGGSPVREVGYFYAPTLLVDVPADAPARQQELFGPVATLIRAKDAEHAIELAREPASGLGASLWTSRSLNEAQALAGRLKSGHVAINAMVRSDPKLPFGGTGTSGYGREMGVEGMRTFLNTRTWWVR